MFWEGCCLLRQRTGSPRHDPWWCLTSTDFSLEACVGPGGGHGAARPQRRKAWDQVHGEDLPSWGGWTAAKTGNDSGKVLEPPSSPPLGAKTGLHPLCQAQDHFWRSRYTVCTCWLRPRHWACLWPTPACGPRGTQSPVFFCWAATVNSQIYTTHNINLHSISWACFNFASLISHSNLPRLLHHNH